MKEKFIKDLSIINDYTKELNLWLKELFYWVEWEDLEYKEVLEEYLDYIWIESNEETRLCAYFRIVDSNENSLIMYMEKNNYTKDNQEKILDESLYYIANFYEEIQFELLKFINKNKLLNPFYREVFIWVHNVWIAFNKFFPVWRKYIINWVNKDLEKKFSNNSDEIISFLEKNNLFDLWHWWEKSDRVYSALVKNENWDLESKSYLEAFETEVTEIIHELNEFAWKIENLKDEVYNSKKEFLDYLNSLIEAFKETNVNKLVEKWTIVDEKWMLIKTPIQIVHPCEYYEDKYRKAVSPDWDLRLENKVFESEVDVDILFMYEKLFDEFSREKFRDSYKFSLENQKRVQLYLSTQVLYYSAFFTGKYSAQVLPNDELASEKFGKKIYALPEDILEDKRKRPFMKLTSIIFDEKLLDEHRKYIFWENKIFYKVYDIETIWHEYWHTLWLTKDTERLMNEKTWMFKNIEEFKASAWWISSYLLKEDYDLDLAKKIITDQLFRAVWLLAYRKTNDVEPYYCESLILLDILFESGILSFSDDKKVKLNFSEELYLKFRDVYLFHYKKLINTYLEKKDAGEFLFLYTIKEDWYFLPKNEKLKEFVEYYYSMYKQYWNEVDYSIDRKKYL